MFDYEGSKPVVEILVLVTYTLSDKRTGFSMIYHDALPKALFPPGTSPIKEFYGRQLPITVGGMKEPLLSGTEIRLLGESQSVVDSCPTSSRVSFIRAVYADGTSGDFSSGAWELAPELIAANSPVDIPVSIIPASGHLAASARILTDGSVEDLEFDHPETVSYSLIESVRSNSRTWKFLPALENGIPVQITVALAIRFRTANRLTTEETPEKLVSGKQFLIVDFEGLAESGMWQVSSAGRLTGPTSK